MSRPQLRCAYEASAPVWEAAEALEGDRAALAELQARHGVDCPLELDLRLAGVGAASLLPGMFVHCSSSSVLTQYPSSGPVLASGRQHRKWDNVLMLPTACCRAGRSVGGGRRLECHHRHAARCLNNLVAHMSVPPARVSNDCAFV